MAVTSEKDVSAPVPDNLLEEVKLHCNAILVQYCSYYHKYRFKISIVGISSFLQTLRRYCAQHRETNNFFSIT